MYEKVNKSYYTKIKKKLLNSMIKIRFHKFYKTLIQILPRKLVNFIVLDKNFSFTV